MGLICSKGVDSKRRFQAWARLILHFVIISTLFFLMHGKGLIKGSTCCDHANLHLVLCLDCFLLTWKVVKKKEGWEEGECRFSSQASPAVFLSPTYAEASAVKGWLPFSVSINQLMPQEFPVLVCSFQPCLLEFSVGPRDAPDLNLMTWAFPCMLWAAGQVLHMIAPPGLQCTLVVLSSRAVLL